MKNSSLFTIITLFLVFLLTAFSLEQKQTFNSSEINSNDHIPAKGCVFQTVMGEEVIEIENY
ncbi:MAG: hypothetical protein AAF487_14670, partial [Bacteroidota bacterium]